MHFAPTKMNSQPVSTIELDGITINLVRKNIKNLHLRVYPSNQNVQISAPLRMNLNIIRDFANSKLDWIRVQQVKLSQQARSIPLKYVDQENHYLWGKPYQLQVIPRINSHRVAVQADRLLLQTNPAATIATRAAIVDEFYRHQLELAIVPLIAKWSPIMGVQVKSFSVRKMKTKWGSCTPSRQTMRFNLELAKKLPTCLEYVVVHELVHLLEPSHNHRFKALMDQFLPNWRFDQSTLDRYLI
jgi:predicted metal-dependent hydrolase